MKIRPNIRVGQIQAANSSTTDKSVAFTSKSYGIKLIKSVGGRCAGY
jgi:hypothetical protein